MKKGTWFDIPTIQGKGVAMTMYFADYKKIPPYIWDQKNGDRYKFVEVKQWDFGGGHTVDKGWYELDKKKDFA